MTINTNRVREEYTASASQTVFNYNFKTYQLNDLRVFVTPVGQTENDLDDEVFGFSVAGVGNESGGTITLAVPANNGDLVTIVSAIQLNRIVDYVNSSDFLPETVNADFDRAVSLIKQLLDNQNRTVMFPASVQGANGITLPKPDVGKGLIWSMDLKSLVNVDLGDLQSISVEVGVIIATEAFAPPQTDTVEWFNTDQAVKYLGIQGTWVEQV